MEEDPRAALIYEAAVRALDQQASLLANLQGRAATLLTAASLVTVTLVGLAIEDGDDLSRLSWGAIASFLLVVGICVGVLFPTTGWKFRMDAHKYIKHVLDADPQPSLSQTHRDVSLHMDAWATNNETKLGRLMTALVLASLALAFEVAFWILELALGR
jgi:hypothetical protein